MRFAQLVATLEAISLAAAGPLHSHHRHAHLHHLHHRSTNDTLSNTTITEDANSTVYADHIKVVTSTVNVTPVAADGSDASSASSEAAASSVSGTAGVSNITTTQAETVYSTLSLSSDAAYVSGSPSNASASNLISAALSNASVSIVVAAASTTPTAVGALSQSVDTTTRVSVDTVYNTITVNGAITSASASEKTVTVTDVVTNYVTATFSALTPFKNPVVRVAAVSSGSSCPAIKTSIVYLPASVSPTLVAGGASTSKSASSSSKATSQSVSTSSKKSSTTSSKKASTSSTQKATTSSVKKTTSSKASTTSQTLSSVVQKGVTIKTSSTVAVLPTTSAVYQSSTSVKTTSVKASSAGSSSAKASSSTCSAVAPPASTQTGIVSGCTKWYTAKSGDYCYTIASSNGISTDTFMSWNPAVNAPSCNNIWVGYAYCVAAGCSSGSASTTQTAAGTIKVTSQVAGTTSTKASTATTSTSAASSTVVASSAYKMYTGNGTVAAGWPSQDQWIDFDTMFTGNIPIMKQSCGNNGWGSNDSDDEIADIKTAIKKISADSGVDPRFILAIVMQESNGCVRVVTTSWSVQNPGLMQDHAGSGTCNSGGVIQDPCPYTEIEQMIKDGTEGTSSGDGLVQCLSEAAVSDVSKYYRAARIYNGGAGGYHADDLGSGCCTLCYSSDVANRLTGWNTGTTGCTL